MGRQSWAIQLYTYSCTRVRVLNLVLRYYVLNLVLVVQLYSCIFEQITKKKVQDRCKPVHLLHHPSSAAIVVTIQSAEISPPL
jgi:hypothetical protein